MAENPKAVAAKGKANYHALPIRALRECAAALEAGWGSYGLVNWRDKATPVKASTYISAILRHLERYQENTDGSRTLDTTNILPGGIHDLGHIMACCVILLDAEMSGTLVDDRFHKAINSKPTPKPATDLDLPKADDKWHGVPGKILVTY